MNRFDEQDVFAGLFDTDLADDGQELFSAEDVAVLEERVAAGDSHAMVELAAYCQYGHKKNLKKATSLYKKAAKLGEDDAMLALGDLAFEEKKYANAVKWYEAAVAADNLEAMLELARLYLEGDGVRKDHKKAKALYVKAAETGDTAAMAELADHYYRGDFAKIDYAKALAWYEKAFDDGWVEAANYIGDIYNEGGYGVEQDAEKAKEYYEKGVAQGNDDSYYALGMELLDEAEPDYERAFSLFTQGAERHSADAMIALCDAYRFGRGTERDFPSFVKWAKNAALAGDERGFFYLDGAFYLFDEPDLLPYQNEAAVEALRQKGDGLSLYILGKLAITNLAEGQLSSEIDALPYWEQASAQGYVPATAELGLFYYALSEEQPEQVDKAFSYLLQAAQAGAVKAMYALAHMYHEGEGTPVDDVQSLAWLEKAAAAGDADACYLLGQEYDENLDQGLYDGLVQRDNAKAFALFKRAAEAGNVPSMTFCGVHLATGSGVETDTETGLNMVWEAAQLGDERANNLVDELLKDEDE
ncbi:tetratricopeptide repeat protein [uncultured Megasphaera sp.]|jgi:TPR repeat protein|uniref:tetratricopeptide repeat protein n=1 Tax=uncultured Megasphaera sp. TaxID=165188 RepID=UPI0025867B1A|nr:tetratricopeptide repeat protein [uncultured Megasphaera sp.]